VEKWSRVAVGWGKDPFRGEGFTQVAMKEKAEERSARRTPGEETLAGSNSEKRDKCVGILGSFRTSKGVKNECGNTQ